MLDGLCKLPGNRGREQSLAVQPLPRLLFWTLRKHLGSAVGSTENREAGRNLGSGRCLGMGHGIAVPMTGRQRGPDDSAYKLLSCLESQVEAHSAQCPGPG